MRFVSTRDSSSADARKRYTFEEAILVGWAEDSGMLLPEQFPQISTLQLQQWTALTYSQLCTELLGLFIDASEVTRDDIEGIVKTSFERFGVPETVRMHPLQTDAGVVNVCELYHGPTLAFKDLGMHILVNFLDFFLHRRGENLTVLVGTSGDTGPSAIEAIREKTHLNIVCLYPKGRVSRVQELQMVTCTSRNVRVVAVEGTSDDLDVPIEEVFGDLEYKRQHNLGSVNSVNICRVLIQMANYIYGYLRVCGTPGSPVRFYIPTGAAGHIAAGAMVVKTGVPISELRACVNENDLMHRILSSPGDSAVAATTVTPTTSPAMDIQAPYNLERLLFMATDGDAAKVSEWMRGFKQSGAIALPAACLQSLRSVLHLTSCSVDMPTVSATIAATWPSYMLDPHTTVGVAAAIATARSSAEAHASPVVCMACAHPTKFTETIAAAIHATDAAEVLQEIRRREAGQRCVQALLDLAETGVPSDGVIPFPRAQRSTWTTMLKTVIEGL